MVGVGRAQVLVDLETSGGGNAGVGRLVGSFPDSEPGVALERADDPVEQRLVREVVVGAGERQPELEPVCRRRVELLGDGDQLLGDGPPGSRRCSSG